MNNQLKKQLESAQIIRESWGKDWHREGRDKSTYNTAYNDILDLGDTIDKLLTDLEAHANASSAGAGVMPDGPGWWAFEGQHKLSPIRTTGMPIRAVYEIKRNVDGEEVRFLDASETSRDKSLLFYPTRCYGNQSVQLLDGKWYYLTMPWPAPALPQSTQEGDDDNA